MDVILRTGKPDDAETCGSICYEAFKAIAEQHNFPQDFPAPEVAVGFLSRMFPRGDIYSVVAEVDGRIVGSNFLWENAVIAGVGPITVDPAVQNIAVGKQLMDDVMRRAQEGRFAGVRLVQAAYHNRSLSLYTKLGFDRESPYRSCKARPSGRRYRAMPSALQTKQTSTPAIGYVSGFTATSAGGSCSKRSEKAPRP